MMPRMPALVATTLLLLALSVADAADKTAKEEFELGKSLIEKNHYDAMGSTQKGMEEGIFRMQEAIRLGYPDLRQAMLLLADSYDQMLAPPPPGSAADLNRTKERNQWLAKLYQAYPDDVEVLRRYATRAAAPEARVGIYKKIAALDKTDAHAHFMLAILMLRSGSLKNGIGEGALAMQLVRAPFEAGNYAARIVEELVQKGCAVPRPDQWESGFLDLDIAAGSGDASVQTEANRQFAARSLDFRAMLGQLQCPDEYVAGGSIKP